MTSATDALRYARAKITPMRDQLVNQLIAGGDEVKTENTRGQIKGLDRAVAAIDEAIVQYAKDEVD